MIYAMPKKPDQLNIRVEKSIFGAIDRIRRKESLVRVPTRSEAVRAAILAAAAGCPIEDIINQTNGDEGVVE